MSGSPISRRRTAPFFCDDAREAIVGRDDDFAVHRPGLRTNDSRRRVFEGVDAIIRDVEFEIAVAIDIAHRHGHGAKLRGEAGVHKFCEVCVTVVEKKARAAADGIDEQIEIAIAIDIGKERAGGELIVASDACGGSDVFEPPVA